MPERENFKLPGAEDGFDVAPPETIAVEQLNSFLDSDPDQLEQIDEKAEEEKRKAVAKKKTPTSTTTTQETTKAGPKPEDLVEHLMGGGPNDDEEDEDEAKEEEGEEDETGDKVAVDKAKEGNLYASLAKSLKDLGIFTPDEDEEGKEVPYEVTNDQEFLNRWQTEVSKQASGVIDTFLNRFGEDYREMFDMVFQRGVPPDEYLSRRTRIEGVKDLDISAEDNQERVVRQLYRLENRTSEYIESRISKLKERGDLEEEAKEAQKVLIVKEEQNLANLAQQRQQDLAKRAQIKTNYVTNVNKILAEKLKAKEFDGIPVDKRFADQMASYLTVDRYETPDKQYLTEFDKDILELNRPENHPLKVKLAMLYKMVQADPTLSKIQKKAVSKESNSLFGEIERQFGSKKRAKQEERENNASTNSDW